MTPAYFAEDLALSHWTRPGLATILIAAASAWGSDAFAHERWANDTPVPGWVKEQCCGASDAHHLAPSQVHVTPRGYRIDGYHDIVPERLRQPSQDGEWWIFYRDFETGDQSAVYCFFGPPEGS